MELKDIDKLNIRIDKSEIEVDATRLVEHAFFENRNCKDYRKQMTRSS